MISLPELTDIITEAEKDKQQISEELKEANDEKQRLAESLSEAHDQNQQLILQLTEAKTLLETLRADNEEQRKMRERSTELIQRNLYLLIEKTRISSEKEEVEKTLQNESQSKEELTKKLEAESERRMLAQKSEKELEEEMERWLIHAKSERFTNTATFNNLSECLNREIVHRMKADVTRELTDKEKDKLEYLLREEQFKCKQLEIKTKTQEVRIDQLYQEKTEHDKKLITEKYEKEMLVKDLRIAEERLKTITTENETDMEKLKHDKEVIEDKYKEFKEALEDEKKRTESLSKERIETESMFNNKLRGLNEELVLKHGQLEEARYELENVKHEHQVTRKNLQSELDDMVIALEREQKLKSTLEDQMQQLKKDSDTGNTIFIFCTIINLYFYHNKVYFRKIKCTDSYLRCNLLVTDFSVNFSVGV